MLSFGVWEIFHPSEKLGAYLQLQTSNFSRSDIKFPKPRESRAHVRASKKGNISRDGRPRNRTWVSSGPYFYCHSHNEVY